MGGGSRSAAIAIGYAMSRSQSASAVILESDEINRGNTPQQIECASGAATQKPGSFVVRPKQVASQTQQRYSGSMPLTTDQNVEEAVLPRERSNALTL